VEFSAFLKQKREKQKAQSAERKNAPPMPVESGAGAWFLPTTKTSVDDFALPLEYGKEQTGAPISQSTR